MGAERVRDNHATVRRYACNFSNNAVGTVWVANHVDSCRLLNSFDDSLMFVYGELVTPHSPRSSYRAQTQGYLNNLSCSTNRLPKAQLRGAGACSPGHAQALFALARLILRHLLPNLSSGVTRLFRLIPCLRHVNRFVPRLSGKCISYWHLLLGLVSELLVYLDWCYSEGVFGRGFFCITGDPRSRTRRTVRRRGRADGAGTTGSFARRILGRAREKQAFLDRNSGQ